MGKKIPCHAHKHQDLNSNVQVSSVMPPNPPSYPTINEVWDVVGADDLPISSVDAYVLQDKKSMTLFSLFLTDDRDNIARLLYERPQQTPPIGIKYNYESASSIGENDAFKNDNSPADIGISISSEGSPAIEVANSFRPSDTPHISTEALFDKSSRFYKLTSGFYKKFKSFFTSRDYLCSGFCKGLIINSDYCIEPDFSVALGLKYGTYSRYKLPRVYGIIPISIQTLINNSNNLFYVAQNLDDYIRALSNLFYGFPNHSPFDGRPLQFPIFDLPNFRMQFLFRGNKPEESMLLAKHLIFFQSPDGRIQLKKQFFPVLFLRDRVSKEMYSVFAGLPGKEKYLPLYNAFGIERIEKAETVVICGAIEDADAMQRYDANNTKNAYVAAVCDYRDWNNKDWDQVDFTPLKGKRVEFLISNANGVSNSIERIMVYGLYQYLKRLQRPRIKGFCFRERIVQYPADILQSLSDYYNAYSMQRSFVISKRTYSEEEFQLLLASPNGELPSIANNKPENKDEVAEERKLAGEIERQLEAKKSHTSTQGVPLKHSGNTVAKTGRPKHLNLTAEKTILRPFIRRGCTTVLTGDPGIGKSRFAIALAAQVAGSKSEFLKDRLWTRCLSSDGEKTGYKVVYWVFDDVDEDDIHLQRNFFARGLSSDQDKNLFIKPARSIRKRDCENLKVELEKYNSLGTPDHPVDFLVIDTLLSFARSPAKIFSAFEELVRLKDELPGLAILVLHHNSKEGNPYGGILATNMPRVIIEMKRDNTSVLDDLEVPITLNVIKHSNEHAGIDILPFDIKLDDDHFVVTNNSELPLEMVQKLVIHEYKHNRLESYSSTDIGRLLGVGRKPIETIWKKDGTKEETQACWEHLKEEYREKAKALNELGSKKKTGRRSGGSPSDG